jgi:hypothetical protein
MILRIAGGEHHFARLLKLSEHGANDGLRGARVRQFDVLAHSQVVHYSAQSLYTKHPTPRRFHAAVENFKAAPMSQETDVPPLRAAKVKAAEAEPR